MSLLNSLRKEENLFKVVHRDLRLMYRCRKGQKVRLEKGFVNRVKKFAHYPEGSQESVKRFKEGNSII
jgi:hypothetical protein